MFTANRSGIERVEVWAGRARKQRDYDRAHWNLGRRDPRERNRPTVFLPLVVAWDAGEDGDPVSTAHVLTKLRRRARMLLLFDALADEQFCRNVVETMGNGSEISAGEGSIRFSATRAFGELAGDEPVAELGVRRAEVERANSSVILGERLVPEGVPAPPEGTNPAWKSGALTEELPLRETRRRSPWAAVSGGRMRRDRPLASCRLRGEPGGWLGLRPSTTSNATWRTTC